MKTFLQFIEEKSVLGLIEFFNFEGLGRVPAKLDSGNGAYNVLHGEDIQEQGNKVFFTTVNGRKLLLPKVDQIDINVGSGNEVSIRELVEVIAEVVGYDAKIVWDNSKPDGTPRKLMDSSKLHNLGWKDHRSLCDGISHTYKSWLSE